MTPLPSVRVLRQVRRELPAGGSPSGGSGAPTEAAAMRQELKAITTALRLDAGAAAGMVHEAVTLCAPVLCYVALGDC